VKKEADIGRKQEISPTSICALCALLYALRSRL
jgi:hypothetical protein